MKLVQHYNHSFFVASNGSWTRIHPLASRTPPDLCLFWYPTFGSSRHCCSSLSDNILLHTSLLPQGDFTICPPGHFGRGDRTRTCDPLVPNQMRYQLRYTPKCAVFYNTSAQLPWELLSFTSTPDWLPEVSTGLYTTFCGTDCLPSNLYLSKKHPGSLWIQSIFLVLCMVSHSAWSSYSWMFCILRSHQDASYVLSPVFHRKLIGLWYLPFFNKLILYKLFIVAGRRIELLFPEWKSGVLTDRRARHLKNQCCQQCVPSLTDFMSPYQ